MQSKETRVYWKPVLKWGKSRDGWIKLKVGTKEKSLSQSLVTTKTQEGYNNPDSQIVSRAIIILIANSSIT